MPKLTEQVIAEIERLGAEINQVGFGAIILHIERGNLISSEINKSIKTPKVPDLDLTAVLESAKL